MLSTVHKDSSYFIYALLVFLIVTPFVCLSHSLSTMPLQPAFFISLVSAKPYSFVSLKSIFIIDSLVFLFMLLTLLLPVSTESQTLGVIS